MRKCRTYTGIMNVDFCQSNRERKHDPRFERFVRERISDIWVYKADQIVSAESFADALLHPILRSTTVRQLIFVHLQHIRPGTIAIFNEWWAELISDYKEWLTINIEFKKAG